MKLTEQSVWRGSHKNIQVKIVRWTCDNHSVWNYYIYLPETLLKEKFESIWLEPKLCKITPESVGFITHEYTTAPYINVDAWHGGITYYAKHGELNRRCVELGCDYNHLWDSETNYSDTLESVTFDAIKTVDELLQAFEIPTA